MYSGQLSRARIRCTETGLKILYDRFGLDIPVEFLEDGSYLALVEVVPGPVFFGWVIGLSQEMRLTGPEELVEQCRAVAQRSLCPWDLETGGRKSSPEPEQSEKDSSPEQPICPRTFLPSRNIPRHRDLCRNRNARRKCLSRNRPARLKRIFPNENTLCSGAFSRTGTGRNIPENKQKNSPNSLEFGELLFLIPLPLRRGHPGWCP